MTQHQREQWFVKPQHSIVLKIICPDYLHSTNEVLFF